jgi:hypothetical protein
VSGRRPRMLPIVVDGSADEPERTALAARWPEAVLALSDEERTRRVRVGQDTVLLDETSGGARVTRGFVRAVLKVPLGHPRASVYGVFVEVDRAAYQSLKRAHQTREPARVWGRLATRLPYLEDAFGSELEILEDGSELRARVVDARSKLILEGPPVG